MKLRTHLLVLTLVTLLPTIAFAVIVSVLFGQRERATFERGATERTLALRTAVDAELKSTITTLLALATDRRLDLNDLRAFHDETVRVLQRVPAVALTAYGRAEDRMRTLSAGFSMHAASTSPGE